MSFHDVLFPLDIALDAEGGPERRTEIITLVSGHEERNSPWADARRRYNAGYGIKSLKDIDRLLAFFEARRGRLYSFRFRDPFDHKSCAVTKSPEANNQIIGTGDGVQTDFQLVKSYGDSAGVTQRLITRPVSGTITIAVDGQPVSQPDIISVDFETGLIQFTAPPPPDVMISAGFVFDTPVRFDTDQLQISLAAFEAGTIPNIPLIEVLD